MMHMAAPAQLMGIRGELLEVEDQGSNRAHNKYIQSNVHTGYYLLVFFSNVRIQNNIFNPNHAFVDGV